MSWVRLLSAVVGAVLGIAPCLASLPSVVKPEDGYLSPTRYLSRYFGLSLVLPAELSPVPAPVWQVQGSTRWLLGWQTTAGNPSNLLITATPPTKKDVVSSLRSDFTDLSDKPKALVIGGQNFWKAVAPRSPDPQQPQIIEYAGIVRDFLLKIRIVTNAGPVPEALTAAIESASFLAPDAVSAARTADMIEFSGPALPELDKPTAAIAQLEPGSSDGRHYRNDSLGVEFRLPDGLKVRPDPTVENRISSVVDQTNSKDDAALLEQKVTQTCTRSLLFADDGTRPRDGHLSPTVMMMAVDRVCLGGVRFPTSGSDATTVKRAAQMLAQRIRTGRTNSEMRGRVYSLQGHVMLSLAGVFYGTEPGTGLRIPNRVRMIATELGDYWVIWTFIAPDTAALDRLSKTSVQFYPAREKKESANAGGP